MTSETNRLVGKFRKVLVTGAVIGALTLPVVGGLIAGYHYSPPQEKPNFSIEKYVEGKPIYARYEGSFACVVGGGWGGSVCVYPQKKFYTQEEVTNKLIEHSEYVTSGRYRRERALLGSVLGLAVSSLLLSPSLGILSAYVSNKFRKYRGESV